ncbi:recombinase family protein [Saccharopolyspora rosea]|uniref:recombinase family protein n=1 Tax=Saccharopolyspora rosea TaxID=524884 RepID=UPI0021DAC9A3|nr:recombinase family protein [Saccharopolyspora rosea]
MTTEISGDPWATLDDLLGVEVADAPEADLGPVAFYGRCSTEDNQDPETSHGWQVGNAQKFVEPLGGTIVAEFFDVGQSRSVPWERRREAERLLVALKDPNRGWNAVVVGEGTRCWFGNQFSLVAPKFAAYGVDLWVPELGGKFDPRNPSHKMLMSVLGGMSESERQHIQARVRAAMDAQVLNEGRHQGGRAPYGYRTVDGGPHPNPRKASEGYRLRVLAIDEPAAEVVRRIFAEYLDGKGDRAIANGLNRDGIPCPSAQRPHQNRHRLADGWQGSTVRAILENPRYTGYAFFGRWTRQETLLDPDDVAAGNVVRFRRSAPDRIVRSRTPAHPAIISVEEFVEAKTLRRARAAGGLAARRKLERGPKRTKRAYPLRGRVRCGCCSRRMEGTPRGPRTYYRCSARTLVPGSPLLAEHPKNVYLPEHAVLEQLNTWIGRLFAPENRDRTVAALLGADGGTTAASVAQDEIKQQVKDAETRIRRLQKAIEAGADPAALVEPLNQAQAERAAAQARLDRERPDEALSAAEIHAMIDSLGDVGRALNQGDPVELQNLYEALGLEMTYDPGPRIVDVSVNPGRRVSARVGGGT